MQVGAVINGYSRDTIQKDHTGAMMALPVWSEEQLNVDTYLTTTNSARLFFAQAASSLPLTAGFSLP